jgi:nucleotide-binding universal stress UspA family protein
MKTILAPVDFSPVTGRVGDTAVALARSLRGRVVLLHIVPPPVITSEYGVMLEDIGALTKAAESASARLLARLRKKLAGPGVPVATVQLSGAPVPLILDQAARLKAAYVVIGSHGHNAFYDLLVGSTTHSVLLKAPCPVVVIHGPRKQPLRKRK